MKKLMIAIVLLCLLAGCAGNERAASTPPETTQPTSVKVGICLPEETDPYWAFCGTSLQVALAKLGCEPEIYYAENNILLQAEQVTQLYRDGASCLILAGIDSVGLEAALADYAAAGIPVIALDRMLMDTPAVKLCVSFDYKAMGETMGRHIEKELALPSAQQEGRSHTVEFFMGSPEDPNAPDLHRGLMSVLQGYLSSGVLTCPSGRTSFEDTWVMKGDGVKAGENLRRYMEQSYAEKAPFPQIICTASDSLAQGCIAVLEETQCPVTQWPLIVGQGIATDSVNAQKQSMTVRKDAAQLISDCVAAVSVLLTDGQLPEGFAQLAVNNHAVSVPVRLCPAYEVTGTQEQNGETPPQEEIPEDIPADSETAQ